MTIWRLTWGDAEVARPVDEERPFAAGPLSSPVVTDGPTSSVSI
jgi:hypothetical protein